MKRPYYGSKHYAIFPGVKARSACGTGRSLTRHLEDVECERCKRTQVFWTELNDGIRGLGFSVAPRLARRTCRRLDKIRMTFGEKPYSPPIFTKVKAMQTLDRLQMDIAIRMILLFSMQGSRKAPVWRQEFEAMNAKLLQVSRGADGKENFNRRVLINGLWEEPLGEHGDRDARRKEIRDEMGIIVPSLEPRLKAFKEIVIFFIESLIQKRWFRNRRFGA